MSDNRFFQVALALVAVYGALSLLTTHLNEVIASVASTRARKLEAALVALLGPSTAQNVLGNELVKALAFTRIKKPSYIPGSTFARALIDELQGPRAESGKPAATWGELMRQVPEPVQARLEPIIADAGASLAEARAQLETWFDDAMDRASGAYKRYTQLIVFVLGFAVAAATNADTITIAATTWAAGPTRALAEALAAKELERCQNTGGKLECPGLIEQVADAGTMPFGWPAKERKAAFASPGAFLLKVLGLIMTGFAVSLGAPFWFDLLKRVAPLGGSGPRPTPSS
jgi:hypothetical protein